MSLKIHHYLSLGAVALGLSLSGQVLKGKPNEVTVPEKRTCGTTEHHEFLRQTRPGYDKDFADYNKMLDTYLENQKTAKVNSVPPIIVPVVIHVLYKTAAQNISDLQAMSQLDVLNADFQRLNTDTALGSAFYSVAGRANIQFCLAQRDPAGNPTNGIVHKSTAVTTFSTNDAVKFSAQGGDDAWDVTKYMNIWICNLGSSLLGYGEFPTSSLSNTYGLVVNYTCAGTMGTAQAPFNKGRTGTHEFGHCFNLYHIWGDDGGSCSGSDQCSDTPNQASENYGCPTLPKTDNCTPAAPGVMCMNYMDYTDDACMVMFSAQQCARMMAVVSTPPWNVLQGSDGCIPVQALDAGVLSVSNPSGTVCTNSFSPVIDLRNFGNTTLTSCDINYQIDNGTVATYNWTGSLNSLSSVAVTLPTVNTTAGTHTLTVTTSNPNASADGNAMNDTKTATFTVLSGTALALPFVEGFEGTAFVPAGWFLNNPDNQDTWERTTVAAKTGVASALMDNYTNDFTGQLDEITTPLVDLTTAPSPQLSFQLAYKLYTNPALTTNYSDTLEVLITTDCGSTWTSLYKKFGTALTTTTPAYANNSFVPSSTQWRQEVVNLSSYSTANAAMLKFRNITQYENNLYVDDINISSSIGIAENKGAVSIEVWPNPARSEVTVSIGRSDESATLKMFNLLGNEISIQTEKQTNGVYKIDLTSHSDGIYFIEVKSQGASVTKRVVVNK